MREFLVKQSAKTLSFIASVSLSNDVIQVSQKVRDILGLDENWAQKSNNWTEALKALSMYVEKAGITIVFNGCVGNNTHRLLDVEEFRGFVLSDEFAPLIFINNSDAKAAQMFTIVHELAHLWLGANGVINFEKLQPVNDKIELFCDQIAAEFLVPKQQFSSVWVKFSKATDPFHKLAKYFKVSPIVCARRALDLGVINKEKFFEFYKRHLVDLQHKHETNRGGGNFYSTQNTRIGHRFAEAINLATKEGSLLYREAYQLTGLNGKTFDRYMKSINSER